MVRLRLDPDPERFKPLAGDIFEGRDLDIATPDIVLADPESRDPRSEPAVVAPEGAVAGLARITLSAPHERVSLT